MKLLIGTALALAFLLVVALVPSGKTVSVSKIAPEVCEHDGYILPPVVKENGLYYVTCSDDAVKLVRP